MKQSFKCRTLASFSPTEKMPRDLLPSGQRGFSMIEILFAMGIMGIMAAGFTSLISTQMREMKALAESVGSINVHRSLTGGLNNTVCTYSVNNPTVKTFNSTVNMSAANPQIISVNQLKAAANAPELLEINKQASPNSNSLFVKSITLRVTGPGPYPGSYSGQWVIAYDQAKLVRPLRPLVFNVTIFADTTVPTQAKIVSCGPDSAGSGTGAPGLAQKLGWPEAVLCGNHIFRLMGPGNYVCMEGGAESTRTAVMVFDVNTRAFKSKVDQTHNYNPPYGPYGDNDCTCPLFPAGTTVDSLVNSGKAM